MEKGPRYRAYTELRESRLRRKYMSPEESKEPESKLTPLKKQVKFQTHLIDSRKGSSVLAQSMPDFSAVLRKENHKPSSRLPSILDSLPPKTRRHPRQDQDEAPARYPPHQNPTMSMPERYILIWARVQEELQLAQIEREKRDRDGWARLGFSI
ncbi:unnamed protein product [Malus baccata var. baccata]